MSRDKKTKAQKRYSRIHLYRHVGEVLNRGKEKRNHHAKKLQELEDAAWVNWATDHNKEGE